MDSCPFYNKTTDEECKECKDELCLCPGDSKYACEDSISDDKWEYILNQIQFGVMMIGVFINFIVYLVKGIFDADFSCPDISRFCSSLECNKRRAEREMLVNKLERQRNQTDEGEVRMNDIQDEIDHYNSLN